MDRVALAERYLSIAERLSGRDLHQMLDRVEDLLELRPSHTAENVAIPSARTTITDEGADVIYRDGRREKIVRGHVDKAHTPKPVLPNRPHGTGTITCKGNRWGYFYYAEIHIAGVRKRERFRTLEEAEHHLEGLVDSEERTQGDAVSDLLNEACPLEREDLDDADTPLLLAPPVFADTLGRRSAYESDQPMDGLWSKTAH